MWVPLRYNFKIRQYLLKVQNLQLKRTHSEPPATPEPVLLIPPPGARSLVGFFLSPFSPGSASALGMAVGVGRGMKTSEMVGKSSRGRRVCGRGRGADNQDSRITGWCLIADGSDHTRGQAPARSWPPFRRSPIRRREVGPRPSGSHLLCQLP